VGRRPPSSAGGYQPLKLGSKYEVVCLKEIPVSNIARTMRENVRAMFTGT
jgi:hypothetical protein